MFSYLVHGPCFDVCNVKFYYLRQDVCNVHLLENMWNREYYHRCLMKSIWSPACVVSFLSAVSFVQMLHTRCELFAMPHNVEANMVKISAIVILGNNFCRILKPKVILVHIIKTFPGVCSFLSEPLGKSIRSIHWPIFFMLCEIDLCLFFSRQRIAESRILKQWQDAWKNY